MVLKDLKLKKVHNKNVFYKQYLCDSKIFKTYSLIFLFHPLKLGLMYKLTKKLSI